MVKGSTPWAARTRRTGNRSRLRRIEGQVRGLERMIDEDEHLRHCVRDAASSSKEAGDEKAVRAVERLLRR